MQDFDNDQEDPPFFDGQPHMVAMETICGPSHMYSWMEIPTSLWPHPTVQQQPQPGSPLVGCNTNPPGPGVNIIKPGSWPSNKAKLNANYNQLFKEFWEKCPKDKKWEPLSKWFQACDTTTGKMVDMLCNNKAFCGQCIIWGKCTSSHCNLQHDRIPSCKDATVKEVIKTMK